MNKTVIFDLDGTLALIDDRRKLSTKSNGKMNWDIFFNPNNIDLDKPNPPVIKSAQLFKDAGFTIVIFSGRSKATKDATKDWLNKFNVPFDVIKLRPTGHPWKFMQDDTSVSFRPVVMWMLRLSASMLSRRAVYFLVP